MKRRRRWKQERLCETRSSEMGMFLSISEDRFISSGPEWTYQSSEFEGVVPDSSNEGWDWCAASVSLSGEVSEDVG
jgi:hypothetical protein